MQSSTWTTDSLSGICADVSYGYTASAEREIVGPRFLRITDIQGGYFNWGTVPFCKIEADKEPKYRLQLGDIVVARTGNTTGENAIITKCDESAVFASYLIRFRLDTHKVLPDFIWYQMRSPDWWEFVEAIKGGSAQPGANAKQLGTFPVSFPQSIDEQREIANIFRVLDDKIALLRETNATLEAIAQALFKSWFVDFDPVRAKAEGREPEGMPPEVADLFPSEFEDSELGEIPKGWKVASLDGVAEFLNGLAMQKFPPESKEEWLPVIKIAQLRKGDTEGADRASLKIKPEYVIDDGDVLFSWSGSLEVVIWCGGKGGLNQHLFKVTSSHSPKWFYYLWTKYHLPAFREIAAHKATTMGHIQRHHLTDAKVVLPPAALIDRIGTVITPLIEQSVEKLLQAKNLASLRDTLLPRLMSGKLRIPEIEETTA